MRKHRFRSIGLLLALLLFVCPAAYSSQGATPLRGGSAIAAPSADGSLRLMAMVFASEEDMQSLLAVRAPGTMFHFPPENKEDVVQRQLILFMNFTDIAQVETFLGGPAAHPASEDNPSYQWDNIPLRVFGNFTMMQATYTRPDGSQYYCQLRYGGEDAASHAELVGLMRDGATLTKNGFVINSNLSSESDGLYATVYYALADDLALLQQAASLTPDIPVYSLHSYDVSISTLIDIIEAL